MGALAWAASLLEVGEDDAVSAESEWLGKVSVADTAFARTAFEKLERLLNVQQPAGLDRLRSTAAFGDVLVQIDLHHVSGQDWARIDLHYSDELGGMFNPLGFEEYYQLRGDPPIEEEALADLAVVLASTYTVEQTWWRGRRIRTVIRQVNDREELGVSVSGWPLLPSPWLLPRDQLTLQHDSLSYGAIHTSRDYLPRRTKPDKA